MGWFSRKKHDGVAGKGTGVVPAAPEPYRVPTDEELEQKLRDIEDVNRRIDENPQMQALMREMFGSEPAPTPVATPAATPPARMETVREHLRSGGISYLASPPADFPAVAPEAHELWTGDALLASMMGDDAACLAAYEKALEITRRAGHRTGEARLLYNIGLAHYKLGDFGKAIEVLLEGKALTESLAGELGREARKLQRFETEVKTDNPRMEVTGVPQIEQWLLEKYLEALAVAYVADSQADKAAACRDEIKRLRLQGT